MTDTNTEADVAEKEKLKFPNRYNVVLHNDDYTPMDFVVAVIIKIYKHTFDSATSIMMSVHDDGSAVVGNYTREMAEAKVDQSLRMSKQNNFNDFAVTAEEE